MLVSELLIESVEQDVLATLATAKTGAFESVAHKLNYAVNYAIRKWPQIIYHGPMFRIIWLPANTVLGLKSNRDILQIVKTYKDPKSSIFGTGQHGASSREYYPWSKTVKGLNDFMQISRSWSGDDYEPHSHKTIQVGVILQQTGVALDFEKFAEIIKSDDFSSEVKEVLSRINHTVSIKMYHIIGLGKKVYSKHDLADFEDDQLDQWDKQTVGHPKDYRFEKDFYFRSDQFNQMQQLLQKQHVKRTSKTVKTKPFDKKSPLKQYKGQLL